MKVLRAIKNMILGILCVVFFIFAISMAILMLNRNIYGITKMDGTNLVIIKDTISSDKYEKGDLVFVKQKTLTNIEIGDEIFVAQVTREKKVDVLVGIIAEVHEKDKALSFENGETYSSDFILGEATEVYKKIGGYLSIVQSTWGFLFIILIPNFLIFIYQLYALIVEIKYGSYIEAKRQV